MSEKEEEMISIYDPIVDAYREISVSRALKWIESAKDTEKKIKNLQRKKYEYTTKKSIIRENN